METVFAGFNDRAQAEHARDELVKRGFDRSDIHIEYRGEGNTELLGTEERSSGGISGFFSRLFGSDDDYERHGSTWNEAVQRGNAVVVVDAEDEQRALEAAQCLNELGAMDIDEQSSKWRAEGWLGGTTGTGIPGTGQRAGKSTSSGKEGVMNVVQEELKVGKRPVDQGGVRVIQRVSSKPVREVIHLREERAVVDRRPVDRPAVESALASFKEGTMEIRESSEEAVVSKTARVVEEVRVSKDVRERDEVIEDTVRRKDVDVERMPTSEQERERAFAADKKSPMTGSREPSPGLRTADDFKKKGGKSGPQ